MSATVAQYPVMAASLGAFRKAHATTEGSERIALVLDMDECLVHTKILSEKKQDYRQDEERPESTNFDYPESFQVVMEDGERVIVNKRPGLDVFLKEASVHFDLYVFTAGLEMYGKPILDVLDPTNTLFKGRFFRTSCTMKRGFFMKDLRSIRSDLSKVVLVDNNPVSFLPQPSNGIPVPSFYDDVHDRTLESLTKVVMTLRNVTDVRPRLHQLFRLADLLAEHRKLLWTIMTSPCCGHSWSDPKVPHLCSMIEPSTTLETVIPSRNKGFAEAIQVFIRIRPLIDRETSNASSSHFIRATSNDTIEVQTAESNIKCKYDAVFGPSMSQEDVYDQVKECTEAFLNGFNATLFAYGQTGSGKSYTMFGAEADISRFRPGLAKSQAGIIPRAIKDIFAGMIKMSSEQECSLYCSFVQIYNENIYDLLRDGNMDKPLTIHEDRTNGIYVEGLSEYVVRSVHDCLALLQCGEENRAVRATHMNLVSSRSHSAFQIFLESKRKDGTLTKSKFNLVDLAGSEKWHGDSAMQYNHVSEMTNINLSLHTLGRCIGALSTKGNSHVPYRDSKLTRLLQDSLGGNTKTRIIATLSPSIDCVDESISTLKFADRAKQVMVCVRVNEQRVIDPAYVDKLEQEINQLRGIISSFGSNNEEASSNQVESQLVKLLKENSELKAQNAKLTKECDERPNNRIGTSPESMDLDRK
ncbi:kinesin, partial [Thraustotheca clavata]